MKNNFYLTLILISVIILSSCSNPEQKWVKKFESCYGSIKTNEDAKNLSQDEALNIAQCLLNHCDELQSKIESMSEKKQEKFAEKLKNAIEKSEHKELLLELDCDAIRDFVNENVENSESETEESSSEDWDKVISEYEAYTDKYIKLLKKANAGDMSAMTEYVEMLEKAQGIQESLENANSEMTSEQLSKFMKVQQKLTNAAASMQ